MQEREAEGCDLLVLYPVPEGRGNNLLYTYYSVWFLVPSLILLVAEPDLFTFTTLMNGLRKGGNVKDAHHIFSWTVQEGFQPDVMAFHTLICGYCREGMM